MNVMEFRRHRTVRGEVVALRAAFSVCDEIKKEAHTRPAVTSRILRLRPDSQRLLHLGTTLDTSTSSVPLHRQINQHLNVFWKLSSSEVCALHRRRFVQLPTKWNQENASEQLETKQLLCCIDLIIIMIIKKKKNHWHLIVTLKIRNFCGVFFTANLAVWYFSQWIFFQSIKHF